MRLTRKQLVFFIQQHPGCRIVMEACGNANYWARTFKTMGTPVDLISQQFVNPFIKGNKNDKQDTRAIAEAAQRPTMRYVEPKSIAQQDMQSLLPIRNGATDSTSTPMDKQEIDILYCLRLYLRPVSCNLLVITVEETTMQYTKKYIFFMVLATLLSLSMISRFAHAKDNQINDLSFYNQYDPFDILQQLSSLAGQGGFPRVDIMETQNDFIIDADVPGVDLDSLKVTIEDDVLTIAGREIVNEDIDDALYHKQERFNGEFVRKIQLPRTIDQDAIKATNNNGVLRITISKKALSEIRNIEIEK